MRNPKLTIQMLAATRTDHEKIGARSRPHAGGAQGEDGGGQAHRRQHDGDADERERGEEQVDAGLSVAARAAVDQVAEHHQPTGDEVGPVRERGGPRERDRAGSELPGHDDRRDADEHRDREEEEAGDGVDREGLREVLGPSKTS